MKRTINLVSYGTSDEEEDSTNVQRSESGSAVKRKLPKIDPSLIVAPPVPDPTLHQGRIRSTPHVEGQFAAFVYVPVPLRKNTSLRALLDRAVSQGKGIEPALVCDWREDLDTTYVLHISLTRPVYLQHYQREELRRAVKMAARTMFPFAASFSSFSSFENDERTRAFLGVEIGAGHSELNSLSKSIEPTLKLLRQKEFYSEPRFHASIAWALLEGPTTLQAETLTRCTSESVAQPSLFTRPIPSFAPSLVPELNARFGQSLSMNKIGIFEINTICVKIGKEISTWSLGRD